MITRLGIGAVLLMALGGCQSASQTVADTKEYLYAHGGCFGASTVLGAAGGTVGGALLGDTAAMLGGAALGGLLGAGAGAMLCGDDTAETEAEPKPTADTDNAPATRTPVAKAELPPPNSPMELIDPTRGDEQ